MRFGVDDSGEILGQLQMFFNVGICTVFAKKREIVGGKNTRKYKKPEDSIRKKRMSGGQDEVISERQALAATLLTSQYNHTKMETLLFPPVKSVLAPENRRGGGRDGTRSHPIAGQKPPSSCQLVSSMDGNTHVCSCCMLQCVRCMWVWCGGPHVQAR